MRLNDSTTHPYVPVQESHSRIGTTKGRYQMPLKGLRYFILLLFFTISGYVGLLFSAEYRIGGANPEALLCRPEGKGPFPAVVHNHGVGVVSKAIRKQ